MDFGIVGVASITVICYLLAECIKLTRLDNRWIPVACGIIGAGLGVLAMFIVQDYPATDYLTAAAVGIVSGLAATGADQVVKQLKNK